MGKGEEQNLPLQQRREVAQSGDSSIAFCRVRKELNFKCLFVLILGFVVFVPGFLWLLPLHERNSGFEAKDAIKLSATVQVYFVLEKPVKELLPHIKRLEFDINGELDIPNVKFPQIVFNFTLTNTISEILDNFAKFRSELKFGLRLRPYENVYFQITNKIGSTMQPPVIVQASISSEWGRVTSQRLQQLAAIINASPERNLGLDYSVFGKVKSVSLSSFLKGTSNAMPPSLSPAPAPAPGDHVEVRSAPHPLSSSSRGLARPPENHSPPRTNCETLSPAPSMVTAHSPHGHSIHPISYPKSTRMIIPPANQPQVSSPYASPVGFPPPLPPDLLPKRKPSFRSKPGETKEDSHRVWEPVDSPHPDHD